MRLAFPKIPHLWLVSIGLALAFWPVWRWYWIRMTDGSDEPLGLLSLVTLVILLWQRRSAIPSPNLTQMIAASLLLASYIGFYHLSYPLVRAGLAVSTLAVIFARVPGALALSLLLFLSLPIGPSLQFFGGYPLRLLVAESSVQLLQVGGIAVLREGSQLLYAGETILVDAPCSGLKMLWSGLFFAAALAGWRQLKTLPTGVVMFLTVAILIAANILRSTLLFFKESHILKLPDWTHSAIGLTVFGSAALLIFGICVFLERRQLHAS